MTRRLVVTANCGAVSTAAPDKQIQTTPLASRDERNQKGVIRQLRSGLFNDGKVSLISMYE